MVQETLVQQNLVYSSTLSKQTEEKAIEELGEDPAHRLQECEALVDWIKSQNHLKYPDATDAGFPLTFLRGAKWNKARAKRMVESYLTMKSQLPEWFSNIDSLDEKLESVLQSGYLVPLPHRDENGCQLMLYKFSNLDADFKTFSPDDVIRYTMLAGAYTSASEETQVNGTVFIFDFSHASLKQMSALGRMKNIHKFHKLWQGTIPGRIKAFHFYNAGIFARIALRITKSFLARKFQKRIHIHNHPDSLYKHVPRELLPDELQPEDSTTSCGSLNQVIDNFRLMVQDESFRQKLLLHTSDCYGIKTAT